MKYEDLLKEVMDHGVLREDRTGTKTLSLFGTRLEYDLQEEFPLITSKKVHTKSILGELLWFLSGSTSAKELRDEYGVTIWDEWQDENGELGPIYGKQWRDAFWATDQGLVHKADQIDMLIRSIIHNPTSRRHIVSSWNVGQISAMALPPCHTMFQVYVTKDGLLDLQLYQRSADMFLGVPFNLASYGALMHVLAAKTGYEPGRLVWIGGDTHVYTNHITQASTQLLRHLAEPKPLPQMWLDYDPSRKLVVDDFHFIGYDSHPAIKAPVAI